MIRHAVRTTGFYHWNMRRKICCVFGFWIISRRIRTGRAQCAGVFQRGFSTPSFIAYLTGLFCNDHVIRRLWYRKMRIFLPEALQTVMAERCAGFPVRVCVGACDEGVEVRFGRVRRWLYTLPETTFLCRHGLPAG